MNKTHTSIYHTQGNAGPERFNRTLLDMLGTLENTQKGDWKKNINSLVYAYNCTPHESTKMSPFQLMFVRQSKLPIDTIFEQAREEDTSNRCTQYYIEDLKYRMLKAREIVENCFDKVKWNQKQQYAKRMRGAKVEV